MLPAIRGRIAARSFVLSHVATGEKRGDREVWTLLFSEVSGASDCVAVQRFLAFILGDLRHLLESPWREDKVDAACALQAVCRLLWPISD